MVFRTLLLTTMTSLLAFTSMAMPNSGTSIQCSDSVFQSSLNQVKTAVQKLSSPVRFKPGLPPEIYRSVRTLSKGNFGKQVVSIGEEIVSIGPTYFENSVRVNRKYFDYLKSKVSNPQMALNFILAHELAHHVEGAYSKTISRTRNAGAYMFAQLKDDTQREVYMHSQVDCLALSLMKNAGMKSDLQGIEDALLTIREECNEYRGKEFCESAHALRVKHVTKWFESIKDVK